MTTEWSPRIVVAVLNVKFTFFDFCFVTFYFIGSCSPKDIAEMIIKCIPVNPFIQSTAASPNGFINVTLSNTALASAISGIVLNGVKPPNTDKRKILVDFSSPDIARDIHMGHLRSTLVGDSICKMLEFCGHDVMRINHVGDCGIHIERLIAYLCDHPEHMTEPNWDMSDITFWYDESKDIATGAIDMEQLRSNLGKLLELRGHDVMRLNHLNCGSTGMLIAYLCDHPEHITKPKLDMSEVSVWRKEKYNRSEKFNERSRGNVVKLQAGDAECREKWELICEISRVEFQRVYDALKIDLKEVGGSFYAPYIPEVIEELESVGKTHM